MSDGYVQRDLRDVRPGDFILDPNSKLWKVLGRDAGATLLIDAAGNSARGPLRGTVMAWDGDMQQAIATVRDVLGGRVVADSSLTR